jgi:hypothetical protein
MSTKYQYTLRYSEKFDQRVSRTQALLKLESWSRALDYSIELAESCAECHVKGDTEVVCVTPDLADLMKNNPKFFDALCEEGVVEWLSPLVLTKSHLRSN